MHLGFAVFGVFVVLVNAQKKNGNGGVNLNNGGNSYGGKGGMGDSIGPIGGNTGSFDFGTGTFPKILTLLVLSAKTPTDITDLGEFASGVISDNKGTSNPIVGTFGGRGSTLSGTGFQLNNIPRQNNFRYPALPNNRGVQSATRFSGSSPVYPINRPVQGVVQANGFNSRGNYNVPNGRVFSGSMKGNNALPSSQGIPQGNGGGNGMPFSSASKKSG